MISEMPGVQAFGRVESHRSTARQGKSLDAAGARRQPAGPERNQALAVIALQRTAGNAAVARMLASRPGTGVTRCATGAGLIQRSIGFEFEDGSWHPWKVDRGQVIPATGRQKVTPVPRKHKLHLGSRFRLEADDTPGPRESNIEFVTEPLSEDPTGLAELRVALLQMREILQRLAPNKGLPGPKTDTGRAAGNDPPFSWEPYDYVTERNHKLSGSGDVASAALALSGGSTDGKFKMQATMGLRLEDIPEAMRTYGNVAAGDETAQQTANRQKARDLQPTKVFTAAEILGRSPGLAKAVLTGMLTEAALGSDALNNLRGGKLHAAVGYLAVVMSYLKGLQVPDDYPGAKSRTMFLARNKFSDMYALLDPAVQQLLATNNGALLTKHVLAVSNANPLIPRVRGQDPDTGLSAGRPLINPLLRPADRLSPTAKYVPEQQVTAHFTIGDWLKDVAIGSDHLTGQAMATWLHTTHGVNPVTAKGAGESVLESFGEYAVDTTGAHPLALFENRGILASGIGFTQAARVAFNYLLHAARIKRHGPAVPYPDFDIPGW
jgi:hypothetical protein